jgi:hypothetical protein
LNDVWASADGGYSWIQVCQNAQWHCRQGHTTVVLDNHLYLIGGFGGSSRFNDMWKSSDAGVDIQRKRRASFFYYFFRLVQRTGWLCHVEQHGLLDKVMLLLHLTGAC